MSLKSTAITHVLHEAVIKVDEEGTVMAAGAARRSVPCCGGGKPRKVKFTADHPFMYFGTDRNGTILFMGTVVDDFQKE